MAGESEDFAEDTAGKKKLITTMQLRNKRNIFVIFFSMGKRKSPLRFGALQSIF